MVGGAGGLDMIGICAGVVARVIMGCAGGMTRVIIGCACVKTGARGVIEEVER
jgi:hypothetical protein